METDFLGKCKKGATAADTVDIAWDCERAGKHEFRTASMSCVATHLCADGIKDLDAGEKCDDGNLVDGDGCNAQCVIETCGDGIPQSGLGEACDDRNTSPNDGCSPTCLVEECGDNITQTNEECDDGNAANDDGCTALCVLEKCGDNVVNFDKGLNKMDECDDGNTVSGDGCSATCKEEDCGDGIINGTDVCDDGLANGSAGSTCTSACTLAACGDGIQQGAEECDLNPPDLGKCSASCKLVATCPDNWVNKCYPTGANGACEEYKVCSSDMTISAGNKIGPCPSGMSCGPAQCGNNIVEPGEDCDGGNTDNGDGCNKSCQYESCGDGVINMDWKTNIMDECDKGTDDNGKGGSGCDDSCRKLECTIVCAPDVDAATKEFKTNCTNTSSSPLPATSQWKYIGSNVGTLDSKGDGSCSTGGGTAHVEVAINFNGAPICDTTTEFKCNVCEYFVTHNTSMSEADAIANDPNREKGCPKSWKCEAKDSNPNFGWSSPDQLGNCYCTECSSTS